MITVACPHCDKSLKLKDRSRLGRKAKCPACAEVFVLTATESAPSKSATSTSAPSKPASPKVKASEPSTPVTEAPPATPPPVADEVPMQLVEAPLPQGVQAEWVPDDEAPPVAATPRRRQEVPLVPETPLIDTGAPPLTSEDSAVVPQVTAAPQPSAAAPPAEDEATFHDVGAASAPAIDLKAPTDGVSRLKEIKRRNAKRRNASIIAGVVTIALLAVGAWFAIPALRSASTPTTSTDTPAPPVASTNDQEDAMSTAERVAAFQPTEGEPIPLLMVPAGASIVVHLHPAKLWSNDGPMPELRAALTDDFTTWIATKLTETCLRDPAQIEEATIVLLLGARGSKPEIATVVRLSEEAKMSDLIEEFGGRAVEPLAKVKTYIQDEHAYLLMDAKTFGVGPAARADEMGEWTETSNTFTAAGIYDVLQLTDRQRLFTVAFIPSDLEAHKGVLFPETMSALITELVEAFGSGAEAAAWSVDLQNHFHSQLIVRNRPSTSTGTLTTMIDQQIDGAGAEMKTAVSKMTPSQQGFATIIKRFPQMLDVFSQSTVAASGPRSVTFTTVLPAKAASNLALGTVLTWDESTRTDFTREAVVMTKSTEKPRSVKERLKTVVYGEFNRTPLQETFDYIGSETKVPFEIDGDALKDAGYTKNMPQTFELGEVPATSVLAKILSQYDKMVLSIDEDKGVVTVLTQKFAESQGKPVFNPSE